MPNLEDLVRVNTPVYAALTDSPLGHRIAAAVFWVCWGLFATFSAAYTWHVYQRGLSDRLLHPSLLSQDEKALHQFLADTAVVLVLPIIVRELGRMRQKARMV